MIVEEAPLMEEILLSLVVMGSKEEIVALFVVIDGIDASDGPCQAVQVYLLEALVPKEIPFVFLSNSKDHFPFRSYFQGLLHFECHC